MCSCDSEDLSVGSVLRFSREVWWTRRGVSAVYRQKLASLKVETLGHVGIADAFQPLLPWSLDPGAESRKDGWPIIMSRFREILNLSLGPRTRKIGLEMPVSYTHLTLPTS